MQGKHENDTEPCADRCACLLGILAVITQAPWESTDAIHCDHTGMGTVQIAVEYQTTDSTKCAVSQGCQWVYNGVCLSVK